MLSRWQSTIVDERGNVQPLANLTVRNEADQSLAKMWASPGTSQPLPDGMLQADGNGYAYFYAPAGLYRIQSNDLNIDWRHVDIGAAVATMIAQQALDNALPTYETLAEMQADTSHPVDTMARVVDDPAEGTNGFYLWDGAAWNRTSLQPASAEGVDAALAAADEARTSAQDAQQSAIEAADSADLVQIKEQEREQIFEVSQEDRENRFDDFIASSGYQFLGDYAVGIEITEYNQIVRDGDGNFWRLSGQTELPYTTTGAGLPEGGSLTPLGEALLRQQLDDINQGAAMLGRGVLAVDSIADLLALSPEQRRSDLRYLVKGYHAGSDAGGGEMYWDASALKTMHNGGSIINPDRPFPSNFNDDTQVISWLTPAGSGPGVFRRVDAGEWDATQFGVKTDGTGDQWRLMQNWLTASGGKVATWTGSIRFGTMVTSSADNSTIRGIGRGSSLKPIWQGQNTFQDILRVSGNGSSLDGFHVDGSEWLDAVPFESRADGNQWAKIDIRNCSNFSARNLSGYAVGNFLNLNNVHGFVVDGFDLDDATLAVHILGSSADGVISNILATRIVESPIDWGGSSGKNFSVTNVNASAEGAWRVTTGEGMDMGGAKNVIASNCIFDSFRQGITLKGEAGQKWGGIELINCQFLRCTSRGISATSGSESETGFGSLRIINCRFTSADDMHDSFTQPIDKAFIRVTTGDFFEFSGNYVENGNASFAAVLYLQDMVSVAVRGNTIQSDGSGIIGLTSSVRRAGGDHFVESNVVNCEGGAGILGGNCNSLSVRDNTVTVNPTHSVAYVVDLSSAKEMDVSGNFINGAYGHALRVELANSKTLGGVTETFIESGIARLRLRDNTLRNWGQGLTNRTGITINAANATGTLISGMVNNNVLTTVSPGTQATFTILATDGQLNHWWLVGNISPLYASASSFTNKLGPDTKQDNLFGFA